MHIIPNVIYKKQNKEYVYDLYSRLLEDRIIILNGEINDELSSHIIAQLLYLQSINKNEDIYMYINSPGGSISSGLAIFDTMNFIKCDVSTISIGCCASMAAFLLAAGCKGKRFALSNSTIMIHQPLSHIEGQVSDIEIHAHHVIKIKEHINQLLSQFTNKPLERIKKDTDRDYYMNALEAKEYGIIDEILK